MAALQVMLVVFAFLVEAHFFGELRDGNGVAVVNSHVRVRDIHVVEIVHLAHLLSETNHLNLVLFFVKVVMDDLDSAFFKTFVDERRKHEVSRVVLLVRPVVHANWLPHGAVAVVAFDEHGLVNVADRHPLFAHLV